MKIELIIAHGDSMFMPAVEDNMIWTTDRQGAPSKLTFSIIDDGKTDFFEEGDPVRLKVDDDPIFFGFVFTKSRTNDHRIAVTAYDQLRYLKNKDTYVYEGKTASQVVIMIAQDFRLNVGDISATDYVIPSRVEDNSTLFDIIQNALDLELQNNGQMYVLYDDFGKLTLRNIEQMKLDLLIDAETAESFDYTSSIDSDTYNQVKVVSGDAKNGAIEVYLTKDSSNINRWGVLQLYETLQEGENGQAKADALLDLYNQKSKTLEISGAFGDPKCRAGVMVVVRLDLGDFKIQNYMLVEKAVHRFSHDRHSMDLTLRGGDVNGQ